MFRSNEVVFKAVMVDAVLFNGTADNSSPCLDLVERISHGNAGTNCFQHLNIVSTISKSNGFCL